MMHKSFSAAASLALALLAPAQADAQQSYDAREVRLLPIYCKYTQIFRDHVPGGNDPAQIDYYTKTMGTTFIHMHHYCWGLMNVNRASFISRTQQDRASNLFRSVQEFDYVLERAPVDFPYVPEILTRKGESLIRLDKGPEAVGTLQRAITTKPDYWPPYAALSDYYKDSGDVAKARDWLEKGLSASPDSQVLARRLAELKRTSAAHTKTKER